MQARSVLSLLCALYFYSETITAQYYTPSGQRMDPAVYRIYYGPKEYKPPPVIYTPPIKVDKQNLSSSNNTSTTTTTVKTRTANEIEQDNINYYARNYPIDENSYVGQTIYFSAPEIGNIYGKYIGKTKNKSGEDAHIVWASPYKFNHLRKKAYDSVEFICFVRWDGYLNDGKLYKKYGFESFKNKTEWDILYSVTTDINAEKNKIQIEKENQAKIENSIRDLRTALTHTIVSFVDSYTHKQLTGNISLSQFVHGYRLRIWSGLDSVFILTDGRSSHDKTWRVYLVDLTKQPKLPIGYEVMFFPESVLKPGAKSVQWDIEKYFAEVEKRVNKKLVKRSVDEMLAYYDKLNKERIEKEEAERKKKEEEYLAKIKQHKAKRKPAGSLIRNSPYHSIVPYYRNERDEQSSLFYLFNYEGYKLAIQAKDSFFILTEFNGSFEIVLIDQSKNPANDEGVVFRGPKNTVSGFNNIYDQRELSAISPGTGKDILYQEDLIREIEKKIYIELLKEIPEFLQKANSSSSQANDNLSYDAKFRMSNWYKYYWGTISMRAAYLDDITPYSGYHFGTHKKMNNFKKIYNQDKKQDLKTVDTLSEFTGDFLFDGTKNGLGVLKHHDSGYLFRGYFSYNEQRRDGIRYNRDGSKTIFLYTEVFTIHNDGSITIYPDVIWKGQNQIRLRPENGSFHIEMAVLNNNTAYSSFPEKNILKTDSSITIAKEFMNGKSSQRFISINKQGDIYIGSIYPQEEQILYKKNGDLYWHYGFDGDGNIFSGDIISNGGLCITADGIYRGIMINGQMDIYGEYLDDKKVERYSGPYKEGKRHGFGKLFTISFDANKNERMQFKNVIYDNGVLKQ